MQVENSRNLFAGVGIHEIDRAQKMGFCLCKRGSDQREIVRGG